MITNQQAKQRLDQFQRAMWSFNEIRDWFGCDLEEAPQHLLAQYRIWAARYDDTMKVLDLSGKLIHRNLFERFLQDRELIPIRHAALRWGMNVESFISVLEALHTKGMISNTEKEGEFQWVFRKTFVSDIHHRFSNISRIIFASFPSYVRRLHSEIQSCLDVEPASAYCATSVALREDLLDFGYRLDCITSEPVGLGRQIWLDTRKPIQLELDGCSWLTMARFYDSLNGSVLGNMPDEFEEKREILRQYINDSDSTINGG